jgi:glycolate oxidase iron-sulfur subunit
MQTRFSDDQRADPRIQEAEKILRTCVHCGFCTATCPTYVLLGDELDSPRGRIYLIKGMLEQGRAATPTLVRHVDRCLSCLACMTTCPSGVDYMHLVDQARARIEATYIRPGPDRVLRALLAWVLPRPVPFRLALIAATLARPFAALLPGRLRGMLDMAPRALPSPSPVDRPQVFPAAGTRRHRVALLTGCAQQVVAPQINEATIRLLTRLGCEVVVASGAGCCGALTHHMGKEASALAYAKANIAAWRDEALDAIVVNASGCGTTVKDYGHMLKHDPAWAEPAARIAGLAVDVSEFLTKIGVVGAKAPAPLAVAYHAACSLQHGQKVTRQPKALLAAAGFDVRDVPEGHLCCGSAGTYNLLQPELASRLRARKLANIATTAPDVIATGNVGCLMQLRDAIPVVHTVELLDWATGGPPPAALVAGA